MSFFIYYFSRPPLFPSRWRPQAFSLSRHTNHYTVHPRLLINRSRARKYYCRAWDGVAACLVCLWTCVFIFPFRPHESSPQEAKNMLIHLHHSAAIKAVAAPGMHAAAVRNCFVSFLNIFRPLIFSGLTTSSPPPKSTINSQHIIHTYTHSPDVKGARPSL